MASFRTIIIWDGRKLLGYRLDTRVQSIHGLTLCADVRATDDVYVRLPMCVYVCYCDLPYT